MPYIGKSPEFGVRQRYYFTQSSGGGTSVSGTDDNGITLKFTDGNFVDVFLNGVLLVDGTDYGTSTANTISNLSALSSGDVIEVLVYDVFNIAKNQAEVTRTRYYKTASGGETSISGNDDSGVAIQFEAGAQLDVSLNGVSLVAGSDYNTSTANTIGGLSALTAGNVIEIVKYEKFVISDTVSKAAGGTFGGAITATSFSGDGSGLTGVSAGKVLQVVSVSMDNALSISSSSTSNFADVTGLVASITPSATGSKVLVMVSTTLHHSAAYIIHVNVERTIGGTATKLGTANVSNRVGSVMSTLPVNSWYGVSMHPVSFQLMDSPSTTSACSYQVQVTLGASYSGTIYVNRTNNDNDADYSSRTKSTITLMEIGA